MGIGPDRYHALTQMNNSCVELTLMVVMSVFVLQLSAIYA